MASTGFGNIGSSGTSTTSGGWFEGWQAPEIDMESALPLFNTENFSLTNMKQAMEASMPKKIMGMNYQQRFQVFGGLLLISALFFVLAFAVGLPMIAMRPQKFALSFTFGSLTFMGSFGILKGPMEHLQGMCAPDRRLFTAIYLGSMFMTLYFTFQFGGITGYALVIASSGMQLVALVWYLVSFLPGGTIGLQYLAAMLGHLLKPVLMACARCQAACLGRCCALWTRG